MNTNTQLILNGVRIDTTGMSPAQVAIIQGAINAAPAKSEKGLTLKIAEASGMLSIYGLGRFPVTLSRRGWTKILDAAEEIKAFLEKNKAHFDAQDLAYEAAKAAKKSGLV